MDRNTLVSTRANKFMSSDDGVVLLSNIGAATFSVATTSTSIVRGIYDNDTGFWSYTNRVQMAGDKIILDFMNGADTFINWISGKIAIYLDGNEEANVTATGLTVADTVTATRFVATSTAATSTFKGITADCFSVDGVSCLGAAGGSYSGTGASGQITFWTGASSFSGASDFIWDNTLKHLGIGTSTPWGGLSIVDADEYAPAFIIASSTDFSSIGFLSRWTSRLGLFGGANKAGYETSIGGATSTQRFALNGTTMYGRMNSDTLMVNVDPMNIALQASLTALSVNTSIAPGVIYVDSTDGNLSITTRATTTHVYTPGSSVTNGCNDGGAWLAIRANESLGAAANEGGIIRGTGVFDMRNQGTGQPPAIAGGTLTSTGTPVMEVTVCTPTVSPLIASSTTLMPAQYGFGFGDTSVANAIFSSTVPAPANGAFLSASRTDNWLLVNTDNNVGVKVDTGISTTTTRTAPQTFRIAMTATATYAYLFDPNTGLWDSIGVNTTRQTKRDFSWFITVSKPNTAGVRHDLLFRNLKVWYSPSYRF